MGFCLLARSVGSIAELLSAFAIFGIVLFITFFTTKLVGTYEKQKMNGRNVQVLEFVRLSGGKNLVLVRAGEKYLLVGESKEHVDLLCELPADSIVSPDESSVPGIQKPDFKQLLEKAGNAIHHK